MKRNVTICTGVIIILSLLLLAGNNGCAEEEKPVKEKPLTFSVPDTVRSSEPGLKALLVIKASGGKPPYDYYAIPEFQWDAGDQMYDMLWHNNFSRLYRYTYKNNVIVVNPGTTASPNIYWVAIQDQVENGVISGTYMLSWWQKVIVCE